LEKKSILEKMTSSQLELPSLATASEGENLCHQCEALKRVFAIRILRISEPKRVQQLYQDLTYFNSLVQGENPDILPTRYREDGLLKSWTVAYPKNDFLLHSHVFRFYSPSQTQCSFCKQLQVVLRVLAMRLEACGEDYRDLVFKETTQLQYELSEHLVAEVQDLSALLMIGPVQSGKQIGLFTTLSPTQIDFTFTKAALSKCLASCHPISMDSAENSILTNFVDVENLCLVQSTLDLSYAALSYVWGPLDSSQDPDLCCTTENLATMRTPGYFSRIENLLPATLTDAILFTKRMGVRYLWVDRLCIVQDDAASKHIQLNAMGSIYKSAVFTIISTGDSVYSGLPGVLVSDGLHLRQHFTRSAFVIEDREIQARLYYPHCKTGNLWATRGWTFQEDMFSRRSFVFLQDTVVFLCDGKEWQEGIRTWVPRGWLRIHDGETHLSIRSHPDLRGLLASLRNYLNRELTYPCDSLAAFAGVLGMMTSFFPGGFHFGIPELCFSSALLWTVEEHNKKDRKKEAARLQQPVADLPTWSWARYSGTVCFPNLEDTYEGTRTGTNTFQSHTTPTVSWYKFSEDGTKKQLINDAWNLYRTSKTGLGRRSRKDIPEGWIQNAQGFTRTGLLEYFKFPIPLTLSDCKMSESTYNGRWSSRLWTCAERAFLWASGNMLFTCETLSPESAIGVINSWEGTCPADGRVECIALSLGDYSCHSSLKCSEQYLECELTWGIARFQRSRYRYYNVMFLSWANGVAERRGIGRTQELKWAALEKERIEVTLV
jgi:hypothetical protein